LVTVFTTAVITGFAGVTRSGANRYYYYSRALPDRRHGRDDAVVSGAALPETVAGTRLTCGSAAVTYCPLIHLVCDKGEINYYNSNLVENSRTRLDKRL